VPDRGQAVVVREGIWTEKYGRNDPVMQGCNAVVDAPSGPNREYGDIAGVVIDLARGVSSIVDVQTETVDVCRTEHAGHVIVHLITEIGLADSLGCTVVVAVAVDTRCTSAVHARADDCGIWLIDGR